MTARASAQLFTAIRHLDFERILVLVERGADAGALDEEGFSTVRRFAEKRLVTHHIEIYRALVKAGATLDDLGPDGETPLTFAARHAPQVVFDLVEAGADPREPNSSGRTPLQIAEEVGNDLPIWHIRRGLALQKIAGLQFDGLLAFIEESRDPVDLWVAIGAAADRAKGKKAFSRLFPILVTVMNRERGNRGGDRAASEIMHAWRRCDDLRPALPGLIRHDRLSLDVVPFLRRLVEADPSYGADVVAAADRIRGRHGDSLARLIDHLRDPSAPRVFKWRWKHLAFEVSVHGGHLDWLDPIFGGFSTQSAADFLANGPPVSWRRSHGTKKIPARARTALYRHLGAVPPAEPSPKALTTRIRREIAAAIGPTSVDPAHCAVCAALRGTIAVRLSDGEALPAEAARLRDLVYLGLGEELPADRIAAGSDDVVKVCPDCGQLYAYWYAYQYGGGVAPSEESAVLERTTADEVARRATDFVLRAGRYWFLDGGS